MHEVTVKDGFWSKVDKSGSCWLWTRSKSKDGYGRFGQRYAHDIVWELTKGPIPLGMELCHRCINPSCVNPSHLFLGTHQENMDDMVDKGTHPGSTLTESQVRGIKRSLSSGLSQKALARIYKTTQANISLIKLGINWRRCY